MRMIIDVADDIPLGKMQNMHDEIQKKYKEYVVDMGWVIDGKFVRNKDLEEEETKEGPKDPYESMLGPKGDKKDPLNNLFGDKEKKDDGNGFSFL